MTQNKATYTVDIAHINTITVKAGTTFDHLANQYATHFKTPIMLVKIGNEFQELRKEISEDCTIEFIDMSDMDGMRVYQRSVDFLLLYVTKLVLGKDVDVVFEHSINKNIYCELNRKDIVLTQSLLYEIENKMREIVALDLPIEKYTLPLEKGIALVDKIGLEDKAQLLRYRRVSTVNLYKIDWLYDYFFGYMVSSTGKLNLFKLILQDGGFVINFPSASAPTKLSEYKPVPKISHVFKEYSAWGRILKVNTVGELNQTISQGGIGSIIRITEALQEKKIAQIADQILEAGGDTRLILVAGPSSSGKTTFAERLCIQLRVNGITPYIISLDNYFRDRTEVPLDEFGKPNFEALEYVDIQLFNEHLTKLMAGDQIELPTYNFITGKREFNGEMIQLNPHEVLLVEGIHGLNEKLTPAVARNHKFKIFISALTQLSLDNHNRISTSDTRLIRRITRDSRYRGASAQRTIGMWSSVAKGENEYIFPFQEEADAMFNSALIYELCVLKPYIEPLLFNVGRHEAEYSEAKRLIKFLDSFLGVTPEDVPQTSIIREFIGGSCFHT